MKYGDLANLAPTDLDDLEASVVSALARTRGSGLWRGWNCKMYHSYA